MKNIILFYGKTNPEFSNFFLADFTIDGQTYPSVEHYFMWEKARMFDPDGEAIMLMSNEKTPQQMKKLGRQVKHFDNEEWNDFSYRIMLKGVTAKFAQNEDLKKKLLDTDDDSILGEASPSDKKWGIGMGVSNPDSLDPKKWRGKNLMGEILMEVRTDLRYPPISKVFYHLKLDIKDNSGAEAERYKRMENVFCNIQEWLFADNPYAYPVITYYDYHAMHLESCVMTVKPMAGVPWNREYDDSEEPRMTSSFFEAFNSAASSMEFERCHPGFYKELMDFAFDSDNKNLAIFVTQPHPSEFSQYCMRIMYGHDDFPVDEDGKPVQYLYSVYDLRTKPLIDES